MHPTKTGVWQVLKSVQILQRQVEQRGNDQHVHYGNQELYSSFSYGHSGELHHFWVQTMTLFLDNSWVLLPLFPVPSLFPHPPYIWCIHLNWVEKLICKLGSCFFILWPLNKGCTVPVSELVLLLTAGTQSEKEPPWLRQRVSAWSRTLVEVELTNSVAGPWGRNLP